MPTTRDAVRLITRDPELRVLVLSYMSPHLDRESAARRVERRYFPVGAASRFLGWDLVDFVLCLLRLNTKLSLRLAERLAGVPITRCPPQLRAPPPAGKSTGGGPRVGDDRVIARILIKKNPWREGSQSASDWALFRVGRSLRALLSRGVTRKHLRRAVRKRWVEVE